MIDVTRAEEELLADPQTEKELYERLQVHIGRIVRVRHAHVERTGILTRISFRRNTEEVFFSFDSEDRLDINHLQHVSVLIDGVWKTVCQGDPVNRSL